MIPWESNDSYVSDSEEEILNKIKSVLVCENTVEFMDNVNIQNVEIPKSGNRPASALCNQRR